jgi:hypothetical protein
MFRFKSIINVDGEILQYDPHIDRIATVAILDYDKHTITATNGYGQHMDILAYAVFIGYEFHYDEIKHK